MSRRQSVTLGRPGGKISRMSKAERAQTAKVEIWLTATCPFCHAALRLLDQHGIEAEIHDLSQTPDRRDVVAAILPGHRTVPLVVIDGDPIGGFQELQGIASTGELVDRVFAADEA